MDFLYAIGLGIILSLVLIGPVFFLLIETSIFKGWKSALILNFGVILADIICIAISYYSSKDIGKFIDQHPALYRIGGFVVLVYGFIMFFSKPQLHLPNKVIVSKNYVKTFLNGFLLNILNIGVIFFWFTVVSSIAIKYQNFEEFALFMGIVLITFFSLDLVKIFLAQKLNGKLSDSRVYMLRKLIGIAITIFGIIIFLKSYGVFDSIDEKIDQKIHIEKKMK